MGDKKEYIERGALIEFVKQNTPHIDGDTTMQCVERAMKAAPAADVVEVRHGEWISVESDVIFKCSICDAEISTSWDYDNEDMFKYCPCCGARMDGERKEQT